MSDTEVRPFKVQVTRVHEQAEYTYRSGYTITAPNYHDAEMEARRRFCEDFGAPFEKTEAFTFNKQLK